ncbi:MAG TPA: Nif3-like dinuclear metal center hexameric protein [Herpetosiphonaceae bacterium]|nr:Nif3-like dinuclear metal center hexameric protein [Herpetosiphonaceae bacterium]
MPHLDELGAFLADLLGSAGHPDDVAVVYRASDRLVTRLGLVLEPWPGLGQWAQAERLDALFLHRPWTLDQHMLAPGVGVVASHRAFDERMTLGFNRDLAVALDLSDLDMFGTRDGRPIGMLGTIPAQSFAAYAERLQTVFGGLDDARHGRHGRASRVAVVGAMTARLVREAAERQFDVYVTGQWRRPADAAVLATGINVAVVGHRRSEAWGLHRLARHVQEQWPTLHVVLPIVV